MYYRFVYGWLPSLSDLGRGLAALQVGVSVGLCVVAVVHWRRHRGTQPPGLSMAAVSAGHHPLEDVTDDSAVSQVPLVMVPVSRGLPSFEAPGVRPSSKRPSSASPLLPAASSVSLSSASLDLSLSFDSVLSASGRSSHPQSSWHFSVDSDDNRCSSSGSSSRSSRSSSSAGSFNVSISIATTRTPREGSFASSADLHRDEDSDDGSGHWT